MIQDICPRQIDIDFKERIAKQEDFVIIINGSNVLMALDNENHVKFPLLADLKNEVSDHELMYLFSIDQDYFYLFLGEFNMNSYENYNYMNNRELFTSYDNIYGYIAYTACHINDWYLSNRYCGKCGEQMKPKLKERVMTCTSCDLLKYPQISPVVIVGIRDKDKLLLTKYANSTYDRYALVAGFVEIGESFEDAVRREVYEEVGLKVKNITYFDSQPWGISGGLLAGYFAELDGDNTIRLDLEELKEGTWLTREELPQIYKGEKSLTRTMMYHWYKEETDD